MSMNEVNIGQNKYCGPAVLSILTGKSTDECARMIGSVNGEYNIKGVTLNHLLEAASRLGFDQESVPHATTLYGTLVRLSQADGLYIVTVTGHFVCVEVRDKIIYLCDNHTKKPIPAGASARLLQQVKNVNKVYKRREPIQMSNAITCDTRFINNRIVVTVKNKVTFDIPKYNKELDIARFGFNTIEEMKQFIDSLNEGAIEWKNEAEIKEATSTSQNVE